MLHRADDLPVLRSITRRHAESDRRDALVGERLDRLRDRLQQRLLRPGRRRHARAARHASRRRRSSPASDLRAAEVDPDDALGAHGPRLPYPAGWRTKRSPTGVYRGGRTRGKVPTAPRPERSAGRRPRRPPPRRSRGRAALRAPRIVDRASLVSGRPRSSSGPSPATSPFRSGVEDANERLPRPCAAALAPQDGSLLSNPSLILLLGTDGDTTAARAGLQPLRLDHARPHRPGRHRIAYLSIPRDLRVDIPGHGPTRSTPRSSSAAPALAMKTIRALDGPAVEPRRRSSTSTTSRS